MRRLIWRLLWGRSHCLPGISEVIELLADLGEYEPDRARREHARDVVRRWREMLKR